MQGKVMIPSSEVFDAGYAISVYDLREGSRTFKFRDEELTVPEFPKVGGPIPWYHLTDFGGWTNVARWTEVKRAYSAIQRG